MIDTSGQVLARLDTEGPESTSDAIVGEALSRDGYVERFAPTDLAPQGRPALLYGHRIFSAGGQALGVLVLRFRFEDELERIFASVAAEREGVALALVDPQGRVVVSNDLGHVPLGATLRTGEAGKVEVTIFAGREYLSVTSETRGYQGYQGPGWRAHAMVSLLTAFRGGHGNADDTAGRIGLDNPELQAIQAEVDAINRNLHRVVWTGRLKAGTGHAAEGQDRDRLKAVLHEVNQAGARTRDRVTLANGDLFRASIGRTRHQALALARLAADIMDRNLYERANDCRWWALSPVLRQVLAQPPSDEGTRALGQVLQAINGLYTVCTRLVVFDYDGVVRGISNDAPASLLGSRVDPSYVEAVASLRDSQRYAVSDFAATPLYDDAPTYVCLAAVRDDGGQCLGGIAIVFHAAREFRAMLTDVLGGRNGWAAFVDAAGRVVSSTSDQIPIGSLLPTGALEGAVIRDGTGYMQATQLAQGHREFKHEDRYANGVSAVVALRLGDVDRREADATAEGPLTALPTAQPAQRREFALFRVGEGAFSLPATDVREACELRGLMRMARLPHTVVGMMELPASACGEVLPVICARRLLGMDSAGRRTGTGRLAAPGRRCQG